MSVHAESAERTGRSGARKAERGEDRAAAIAGLDLLRAVGWLVLHDVAVPGDVEVPIDHVLAGPSGVYVINSISGSGPVRMDDTSLFVGSVSQFAHIQDVASAALALREAIGGRPVVPILCFQRPDEIAGVVDKVAVCSTENILELLNGQPQMLGAAAVNDLMRTLNATLERQTVARRPLTVADGPAEPKPRHKVRKRLLGFGKSAVPDEGEPVALSVVAPLMESAAPEVDLAAAEAERAALEEAARLEAERVAAEEAARVEAERVEAERVAAEEAARLDAERVAAERLAAEEAARLEAERVEAERLAAEEAARLEAERVEAERLAAEEAARLEAERVEAERVAAEAARVEAEHLAAEEAARVEAERLAAEEAARAEAERLAAEEAARAEAERLAAEEAARVEAERLAAEEAARVAAEAARVEAERVAAEAARVEAERVAAEAARVEAERVAAEAARLEAERVAAEAARVEAERVAAEEAARLEAERLAAEEAARLEAERLAAEEAARLEAERLAAGQAARAAAERLAAAEAARVAAERVAAERLAVEEAARAEAARLADEEARREADRLRAGLAAQVEFEPEFEQVDEAEEIDQVVEVVEERPVARQTRGVASADPVWRPIGPAAKRVDVKSAIKMVSAAFARRDEEPEFDLAEVEASYREEEPASRSVPAWFGASAPAAAPEAVPAEPTKKKRRSLMPAVVAAVVVAVIFAVVPRVPSAYAWGKSFFVTPPPPSLGEPAVIAGTPSHPTIRLMAGVPLGVKAVTGGSAGKGKHWVGVPIQAMIKGDANWSLPVSRAIRAVDNLGIPLAPSTKVTKVTNGKVLPKTLTLVPGKMVVGMVVFAVQDGRHIGTVKVTLSAADGAAVWNAETPSE